LQVQANDTLDIIDLWPNPLKTDLKRTNKTGYFAIEIVHGYQTPAQMGMVHQRHQTYLKLLFLP